MSKKLERLLAKIFAGSIGALIASPTVEASVHPVLPNHLAPEDHFASQTKMKPRLVLRLVTSTSEWKTTFHRSHRSHSSHRSHYSHYSSSSGSSGSSNSSSSPASSEPTPVYSAPAKQELGSRILKLGMKGTDVTQLINIMLSKGYLVLNDSTQTAVTGIFTFDSVLEDAVKRFQTDNSIKSDGIVNATTVYYLKKDK